MTAFLAAIAWLAAAEPSPPPPPQVFSNDTVIATVTGENLAEVSFVAAHCVALQRHLEFALNLPAVPGPVARIEIADVPGLAAIDTRVGAGAVLVIARLGSADEAPMRAAEAAAQAWLARVALAGGRPVGGIEPWTRQALAAEVITQLRPSMNDFWYREARRDIPAALADVLAGRAPAHEAWLFWRALRRVSGPPQAQAKVLIASAHGDSVEKRLAAGGSPADWWLIQRAELLLSRTPASLGMRESADTLDDMARFVFDVGAGDQLIPGAELVQHRTLAAVRLSLAARLSALRRELLRQNPVYHNAWRAFGAWLEATPTATPEELGRLWTQYAEERRQADGLRREIEAMLEAPLPPPK